MSLNQKYTWKDFLRDHPEHKEKKTKRTSKEGQKAFEAAYKNHAKEFLKSRLAGIDAEKAMAEKSRKELAKELKETKADSKACCLRNKICSTTAQLGRLEKLETRTKAAQKNL